MSEEIQELFARTLEGAYDDDKPWEAVRELRKLGTREIFDAAAKWCSSDEALKRSRGADVLAQLGKTVEHPSNVFPEDSYSVVARMLKEESDSSIRPLCSAIFALGHLDNTACVALIRPYEAHTSSEVRYAVTFALGCYPDETKATEGLIKLTADVDDDVRDWATFGLGVQGDADTDEIREVLAERLSDPNRDVREEAVVGLAKRKDSHAIPILTQMLSEQNPSQRVFDAAALMLEMKQDDPALRPADYLAKLRQRF